MIRAAGFDQYLPSSNAVELLIAILAMVKGEIDIVQASMIGSILSNSESCIQRLGYKLTASPACSGYELLCGWSSIPRTALRHYRSADAHLASRLIRESNHSVVVRNQTDFRLPRSSFRRRSITPTRLRRLSSPQLEVLPVNLTPKNCRNSSL